MYFYLVPVIDVAAVIGQDAELPCDISTPGN